MVEATGLRIQRLDPRQPGQVERWETYVLQHPQATFFHRAGWERIMREVFRHDTHFLLAERDGSVCGVLPLAHVQSRLFGNALTGLPFAVYGGALADDEAVAHALEAEAQRLAQALGVDHLELRHTERRHTDWPVQTLYVTFRKAILPGEEDNMNAIPRKQRAMVRKGIKSGLVSAVDADVDRFFALYADNVHRHGTPALPRRYFAELYANVEALHFEFQRYFIKYPYTFDAPWDACYELALEIRGCVGWHPKGTPASRVLALYEKCLNFATSLHGDASLEAEAHRKLITETLTVLRDIDTESFSKGLSRMKQCTPSTSS